MNDDLRQIQNTPRTTNAQFSATTQRPENGDYELLVVDASFARALERELADLREKLAIERSLAIAGTLAAESRDTLAEENAALRKQVSELQSDIAAKQERTDYWANRAELDEQELDLLKDQIARLKTGYVACSLSKDELEHISECEPPKFNHIKPMPKIPTGCQGTLDELAKIILGGTPPLLSKDVDKVFQELVDKLNKSNRPQRDQTEIQCLHVWDGHDGDYGRKCKKCGSWWVPNPFSHEPLVDWNPNIDAGEGWRRLAVGEVTKSGDEIWSMGMDHWVPVHIATHPNVLGGDQVRRKTTPPINPLPPI